jgi:hypothetical protein
VSYTKLKKSLLKRKLKRKSHKTKKRHPNRKNRRKSLKLSKKKRMMMTKTLMIPLMLSMERTTINNSLLLLKRNQTVKSLKRTLTRLWLNLTQNLRKQRRNLSLRRRRKNKRRLAMTQVRRRSNLSYQPTNWLLKRKIDYVLKNSKRSVKWLLDRKKKRRKRKKLPRKSRKRC